MQTRVQALFFVAILACAAAGCGGRKAKPAGAEAIPVRVRPVEIRDMRRSLDYVADVSAQDEATVYPRVTGKILEKLKEDGAPVKKGEAIAWVDRDEVGLKFEKAPVESPISGVVGRIYVDRGSSVSPQTPVALVVAMDTVRVRLDVPEKYLPSVAVGQSAEIGVDAWASAVFTGKVTRVSPVVDSASRTAPAEIAVANADHKLKPGMFCRVKLVIEEKMRAPVVTKEAIFFGGAENFVYVVDGATARRRAVKTGLREGPDFEITEGLKEGELVVVMGQQRLRDGAAVKAEVENEERGEKAR